MGLKENKNTIMSMQSTATATASQLMPDNETMYKIRSAGLITKGAVYILLGVLATLAALGAGGQISGKSGLADYLAQLPAGNVLLILTALGLLFYALWRLYQVFGNPGLKEDNQGIVDTVHYLLSGLIYGGLAYSFARPVLGGPSSGGGSGQKQAILADILEWNGGAIIVGIIAVITVGVAFWQFYLAYTKKYMKKIDGHPGSEYELIEKTGRWGYAARGVVFGIFAFFFFQAMAQHNANEFQGTGGALQLLQGQTYGTILLILVALGLACYGVFNIMVGRHAKYTLIS